jgi:hypothetical protein
MRYIFAIVIFIVSLCTFTNSAANYKEKSTNIFINTNISAGEVLMTNDFVKGINRRGIPVNDYAAIDLRVGWQTLGKMEWQRRLNLPYFGIGLYMSKFYNNDEIGYPNAIYFMFGGPFIKRERYAFNYEFSGGISYNWKPYNKDTNQFNVAIGSENNCYIDLRLSYSRNISKTITLSGGIRFTHFSNGAIAYPNKGINTFSPFIGIKQRLTNRSISKNIDSKEYIKDKPEFNILFSYGRKSVKETKTVNSRYVSLYNLSVEYFRAANYSFKYGVIADMGIDENKNLIVKGDNVYKSAVKKQLFLGTSAAGQFRAGNMAVQLEFGAELISPESKKLFKRLYQKLGLRYYINDKAIVGVRIKAKQFSVANYIEWSIGYKI